MTRSLSIAQLKAHLSEIVGEVQHTRAQIVIEKHGKPMNNEEVGKRMCRHRTLAARDVRKATIKGISYFSAPGVAEPEAGTCKWSLTRVDTTNPGVETVCER